MQMTAKQANTILCAPSDSFLHAARADFRATAVVWTVWETQRYEVPRVFLSTVGLEPPIRRNNAGAKR